MPATACAWLRGVQKPWWIAGGWALDLYLGRQTRDHADLDVACFRADLPALRAGLAARGCWELQVARDGRLRKLHDGEEPETGDHILWCRPVGASHWALEIMLEERDGEDWVFRRDRSVRLAAERLVLTTQDGTPFIRPEVQLLYKAEGTRSKDTNDLNEVLPNLDSDALEWLRGALMRAHPDHRWIDAVDHALPRS